MAWTDACVARDAVVAVLRRIERDDGVVDALIKAADNAPSASARLSELSLLGQGCTDKSKARSVLERCLASLRNRRSLCSWHLT